MPGEPILIVDDSPVSLKMLQVLLQLEGYDVHTAPGAEEALHLLENLRPRLMLVDLEMPRIDGLELTRRLNADPAWSDLVVVAVTAAAMKGDEQKVLQAGCDGYVAKPVNTRTLPGLVAEYLSRSRAPLPTGQNQTGGGEFAQGPCSPLAGAAPPPRGPGAAEPPGGETPLQ